MHSSRRAVGPIVGPIVGCTAALFLFGALVLWQRQRAKNAKQAFVQNILETPTVPYTEMHPQPYHRKEMPLDAPTAIDPLTAPAVTATTVEVQDLDRDAVGSAPAGLQHEPIQPLVHAETESIAETDNIEAVPDIVDRLNRIMARIPPGGVMEEEPPAYDAV